MGTFRHLFIILALIFSIFSSHAQQFSVLSSEEDIYPSPRGMKLRVMADEFKIMSYNVLNLFDNLHDVEDGVEKQDHTFLPKSDPRKAPACKKVRNTYYRSLCFKIDWDDEKLLLKLRQIQKSIRIQGSLPDMLALQEVENENVVQMLGQQLGYDYFVMTRSPDKRGIDVALLFNQDKVEYLEHQELDVSSAVNFRTRNILRVNFAPKVGTQLGTKILSVYVNHWPSQAAGSIARYTAAEVLATALSQETEMYGEENYYAIVIGDFNTVDKDDPHPFYNLLTNPDAWENYLYDVHSVSYEFSNPMIEYMPGGTYWYSRNRKFNLLDRIFVSQNLHDEYGMQVLYDSYRIVGTQMNSVKYKQKKRNTDFIPVRQMIPYKYNFFTNIEDELGFSDHYPIVVKVKIK